MLKPTITLAEILPPGTVISQRVDSDSVEWLPKSASWRERTSIAPIPIAGDLPLLCHQAGATDAGLSLLETAGLRVPAEIITYRTPAEFQGQLDALVGRGCRIAVGCHPGHPRIPEEAYLNPLPLLRSLNDKANLADLLPAEAVPERRILSGGELSLFLDHAAAELPFVIKISSELGTSSGLGLVICRKAGDIESARRRFATADRVVVEAFYDFTGSWCVNVAISEGSVRCVGAAEQICRSDGSYHGNWCESLPLDEKLVEIAEHAGRAGKRMGYHGILGADIGRTADGRWLSHDLNYRLNGSTRQVLFHPSLQEKRGVTVTRSVAGLKYNGSFSEMIQRLTELTQRGQILPLLTVDPQVLNGDSGKPSCGLLVLGNSRAGVTERMEALKAEGFAK